MHEKLIVVVVINVLQMACKLSDALLNLILFGNILF